MDEKFLLVNEIFYSLIGESSYVGFPAVFIRLSGCNLNCVYCDTKYANENGEFFSLKYILDKVKQYDVKRVLITGGEPLSQKKSIFLMEKLLQEKFHVFLETNGSYSLKEVPGRVKKIVDVKTPGSGECGSFLMDNLAFLRKGDNLKFVISSKDDFFWSLEFIKRGNIPEDVEILFSPVFEKFSPNILANLILEERVNVRLNLQIHKILKIK